MEPRVDRIGAGAAGVESGPDRAEAEVVVPAAERARPVSRGERRRFVEEEKLGEPARLEERASVPVAEDEPARDPAPPDVAAADPPGVVVQAPAIPVHETAVWGSDELAERRDAVLERPAAHLVPRVSLTRMRGEVDPPRARPDAPAGATSPSVPGG